MDIQALEKQARQVRRDIITMVSKAGAGHPGGSLSCTDALVALYFEIMNVDPANDKDPNRDRFVLSKGHCSPGLYGILKEAGLIDDDIHGFRQLGSRLQGHPNMSYIEAVDMSTGSLGQGVSAAVGMAIANKLDKNENRVYALCGDGESEEGIVWEALMSACHYELDNLCIIFDVNHLQIDGNVQDVIGPLPLLEKAQAFGAHTIECDGNDFDSLRNAFAYARQAKGKPTVIIANTTKGKGVSYMENNYAWHGAAPKEEDYKIAMEDLKEVH